MRKPYWTSSRNVKKSFEPSQWGFPFFFWRLLVFDVNCVAETKWVVQYVLCYAQCEIFVEKFTHEYGNKFTSAHSVSNKTKTETFSCSSRQLHWCTLHTDPPNSKSGDCVVIILNFCSRSSDGVGGGGGSRSPLGWPENFWFGFDIRDTSDFTICNSNWPSWKQNSLIHPLI